MIRNILVGAALVIGVTTAFAQGDVIAQRKELMKSNGAFTRTGAMMVRGTEPFDLAKAKAIFANYENVGKKFSDLFPDSSKTGGETKALPKIWQDMPGFKAAAAKFVTDATAASAATTDLATFRIGFGNVTKNCETCHQSFRAADQ